VRPLASSCAARAASASCTSPTACSSSSARRSSSTCAAHECSDADTYELADGARRFENWEFAWSLVLGLGAAARYALQVDVGAAGAYAAELTAYARERLALLPGVRVLDRGQRLAAIATAAFEGHDAGDIVLRLREQAINTSMTDRGSAVIDMDTKGAGTALRVSPHYYNTPRDIDILASALEEFAAP
jgi:selenocysteine lyase/cysteine desulfurase